MATPRKGKKYVKVVKNKTTGRTKKVSYGDANATIAPGTSKGDAYCARSNAIKGNWRSDPNSPNNLSRKKWKCNGNKSTK